MGTDTEPVRIRPSLNGHCRTLLTGSGLALLAVTGLQVVLAIARGDGDFVLAFLGAFVLCGALPLTVWLLRACVWTTDSAVHRRGLLGRTQVVPRDAVGALAVAVLALLLANAVGWL